MRGRRSTTPVVRISRCGTCNAVTDSNRRLGYLRLHRFAGRNAGGWICPLAQIEKFTPPPGLYLSHLYTRRRRSPLAYGCSCRFNSCMGHRISMARYIWGLGHVGLFCSRRFHDARLRRRHSTYAMASARRAMCRPWSTGFRGEFSCAGRGLSSVVRAAKSLRPSSSILEQF